MFLDTAQMFILITAVTFGLLATEWAMRRSMGGHMTAGNAAKTLKWIAVCEIVIAIAYAAPFPAPAKPDVWVFPVAAFITFMMAVSAWTMDVRQPTPAVVRSRARRRHQ